jgi:predicted metal-dependent enzyme (double-stranded beta helix superfamily)
MLASIERFAERVNALWAEPLTDPERWARISDLMSILLEDPGLKKHAASWGDTNRDGYKNVGNLLLYEDPKYGWVINSLVKGSGGQVPAHDHAHIWTAYGVIEGSEKIYRYELVEGDRTGAKARLKETGVTEVVPGDVDLVAPYEAHAEIATAGRTVAIMVRSEKLGRALHAVYIDGEVTHRPGPEQLAIILEDELEVAR